MQDLKSEARGSCELRGPNAENRVGAPTGSRLTGLCPPPASSRWPTCALKWLWVRWNLLLFAACLPASAQTYAINWWTLAGGGGTSTGGVYTVSGTIGQPDAGGPMTNGQYSVTGGFWALPSAVQDQGAPTLTIVSDAPGFARVSWTPNTPGFVLRETPSLSPTNWMNSPSGSTNPVVVPATLPSKFYRLHKP